MRYERGLGASHSTVKYPARPKASACTAAVDGEWGKRLGDGYGSSTDGSSSNNVSQAFRRYQHHLANNRQVALATSRINIITLHSQYDR